MAKRTCTPWKKVHKRSGSTAHERTCGRTKISIVKWKSNEWSAAITSGSSIKHAYGKTLRAAKAAAMRKIRRRR